MNTTTQHFRVILVALMVAASCQAADDIASKGREIFKKYQPSVVTVQLVVKSKLGFAGLGGDARESKQEVTGTVIDSSGLVALSLASTDPTSLIQGMLGGLGGDGEDSMKFKMESELSDVKLLLNDGTELPSEIVLRDRDLDLAFLRPKSKPPVALIPLDLSKSAKVDVLDQVIAINRLGKVAGRTHAASVERINAVVQRPRPFYVPGGDAGTTSLGCPAFTLDGQLVGLFVMRTIKSGGGGGLFGAQGGVTAILLPAEDVRKVAAQVPPLKDEAQ